MSMTVKKLRKVLKSLPNDMLVVLSSDEEGNSYHELCDAVVMYYSPSTEEAIDEGDLEEYGQNDSAKTLVLWP
jgi:hypothetical protein